MKINRIYAVLLRHLYNLRRSYDRLTDSFYWIALDLLIWGITGVYFQRFSPEGQNIVFVLISGVILWNISYRAQIDLNMSILEEIWNKNLINLFVSPIKFNEWMTGLIILGLVKSIVTLIFGSIIGYFLYKINIYELSYHLPVFIFLLLMTGWWLGFFISGIILRYGSKVQTLAWTLVWVLSPFSAIYYPLSILPDWVQKISLFVPTSYVFEQGRNLLFNGEIDYSKLAISFGLNVIYLIAGLLFIRSSFKKVLAKGLVKVY